LFGGRGFRVGIGDLDYRGEVAEVVVGGDFFDLRRLFGEVLFLTAEIGRGDLEAVEQDAATFEVDVSASDAAEDVEESELNGGAVVDARHGEGASAGGAGGFAAGADVVVAEILPAEGGRAAAVAFCEDVAAEVAAFGVEGRVGGVGGNWLVVVV
jgi:hypothetical protein